MFEKLEPECLTCAYPFICFAFLFYFTSIYNIGSVSSKPLYLNECLSLTFTHTHTHTCTHTHTHTQMANGKWKGTIFVKCFCYLTGVSWSWHHCAPPLHSPFTSSIITNLQKPKFALYKIQVDKHATLTEKTLLPQSASKHPALQPIDAPLKRRPLSGWSGVSVVSKVLRLNLTAHRKSHDRM